MIRHKSLTAVHRSYHLALDWPNPSTGSRWCTSIKHQIFESYTSKKLNSCAVQCIRNDIQHLPVHDDVFILKKDLGKTRHLIWISVIWGVTPRTLLISGPGNEPSGWPVRGQSNQVDSGEGTSQPATPTPCRAAAAPCPDRAERGLGCNQEETGRSL